jgi:anti-sigma B factor antagonist
LLPRTSAAPYQRKRAGVTMRKPIPAAAPSMPSAAGLEQAMAAGAWLSTRDHGGVAVMSLRGELDFTSSSVLQAYLGDQRWQARKHSVADLTGLAFIDCACLGILVWHCMQIRSRGSSFALAGAQPAVRRILAVTGRLNWFDVHDTVELAVTSAGTQR